VIVLWGVLKFRLIGEFVIVPEFSSGFAFVRYQPAIGSFTSHLRRFIGRGLALDSPHRSQRLALQALDLGWIGTPAPLQLQVLADCFIE
jgi:hypothetical protein